MEVKLVASCEDPGTVYLELPDIRLIFRDGKYIGWYSTGTGGNEGS